MPGKDLRYFVKQERSLQISLNNIRKFVENFTADEDVQSLKLRSEKLDEILEKFSECRLEIELATEDACEEDASATEEPAATAVQRKQAEQSRRDAENVRAIEEFENEVFRLKQMILNLLPPTASHAHSSQLPVTLPVAQTRKVKLPELKLPSFSGKVSEWVTFRDTYKNLIHNDGSLSDMDKFTYLRTSLTGDALQEIASVEISSDNYPIAWKALEDLYENKKLLVTTHLDSLFALEPLRQENFESLNRLVNGFEKNLQMLKKIGEDTDGWSTVLQYMLCKRLHPATLKHWESHYSSKEVPEYSKLVEYLKGYCLVLQSVAPAKPITNQGDYKKLIRPTLSHPGVQPGGLCPFCNESAHSAFKCQKFIKMKISERVEAVRKNGQCLNCLGSGHIARTCIRGMCQHCGRRHHSLLHATSTVSTTANQSKYSQSTGQSIKKTTGQITQTPQSQSNQELNGSSTHNQLIQKQNTQMNKDDATKAITAQPNTPATDTPSTSYHTAHSVHLRHEPHTVLLSTAIVNIVDQFGNSIHARALLDSGSQRCYMSENLSQKLKFRRSHEYLPIIGIAGSRTTSTQAVLAEIRSRVTDYKMQLKFHVLPQVTVDLPVRSLDISSWILPDGVELADPTFFESKTVDLIIGAEIYLELIIQHRQLRLGDQGPTLQNTLLGWIISGIVQEGAISLSTVISSAEERVEEELARFFELETCRTTSTLSLEESACEAHFEKTTCRDSDGRFVVHLPKKQYLVDRLGESRTTAIRQFMALERRLNQNPAVKKMYTNFIDEYLRLQHMHEVPSDDQQTTTTPYYLPHHAVLKPDSTTTKLRVVFNASCATSSGISLNDSLMVGPVVQRDIFAILLGFRLRKIALIGDIEKMYRMIKVHPKDYYLQRIVWREDSSQPIRTFELRTVTYGTSPAPYLATRCLKKLAEDNKEEYSLASETILNNIYVDDLLKSVDSVDEGIKLYAELIKLLGSAGLLMRKWNSNACAILDQIPPYLRDERVSMDLDLSSTSVKTLGMRWEPGSDEFTFTVPEWNLTAEINKRSILSDFARLFDPFGFHGPVIITAKIFIQDLWKLQCSWTDPLSEDCKRWWIDYRNSLSSLPLLRIPRWIAFGSDTISAELHGFCDASKKAYGACLYLRCTSFNGDITVTLLASKSRVTPLSDLKKKRKKVTIPRLELCSALLCSHVYEKVDQSIPAITTQPTFWTDSEITLAWLSSAPSRWDDYVANRTCEIQNLTRNGVWKHIAGVENPADVLSRGMAPDQLSTFKLWWQGPTWLSQDKTNWPISPTVRLEDLDHSLLEEKSIAAPVQDVSYSPIFELRSSLTDLIRIVAIMLRFVHNLRNPQDRRNGFFTCDERDKALLHLTRLAQSESFPEELAELKRNREVKPTSKIKALYPQLVDGIMVVGGRLRHANIPAGRKHPIILDNKHPLSNLIATHYHHKLLHAGQQLLISSMRERFWPISAKSLARKVVRGCVKCFRVKPRFHDQLMADLPEHRVTPAPPFLHAGVDYCGPFYVKYPHRRAAPVKCFVAVFVCFASKAVHLEVVADLTSQSFIAALKRFTSRRGRPDVISCDNSTTFVGARRELDELRQLFNNQDFIKGVMEESAAENINFQFIPARSPNFGGLWEAAVKSMKGHLKRTLGNVVLNLDEMTTLIQQIEACLNSRPITPISNDPLDLEALTPGHFLVFRPLTAIPEPALQNLQESRLSRWQKVQNYMQKIWRLWSTQYLSELHIRNKWTRQRNNLFVGTLVLLRDENTPPLKWRLGRVTEVHPGDDGNIRVVKLHTKDGDFTRAITKISILPIRDNEQPAPSSNQEA